MLEFMFMEAGNLSSGMVLYLFQTEFYDYFFLLLKRPDPARLARERNIQHLSG